MHSWERSRTDLYDNGLESGSVSRGKRAAPIFERISEDILASIVTDYIY